MARFREVQRFRQPWILAIVGVIAVATWATFVQQIVRGRPVGDEPASDWVVWLLLALFGIALPAFLWLLRMETLVFDDRVEIRMKPLSQRIIPAVEIAGAEARTYRPLHDFGGWGVRGTGSNRAYNVSGDQGVQLVLNDGKRILIGTQRPADLAAAIAAILPA